ncbi:ATP-binding cassette domain-containing protein [Arcanobacterium canis]
MIVREGKNLRFSYGSREVFSDLNIELPRGLTGLVGPNGAGKTTVLRILAGIIKPSSGYVMHDGEKILSARSRSVLRQKTGYLPQNPTWTSLTSVGDFVEYCFRMNGGRNEVSRAVAAALEATNVYQLRDRKIGQLSGGERRRVYLAGAIVHSPEVVILDEPTVGLDPEQRIHFRQMVENLATESTVLLSTHIIEDLSGIAHAISVLNEGKVIWNGTVDALRSYGEGAKGMSDLEAGYLYVLGH